MLLIRSKYNEARGVRTVALDGLVKYIHMAKNGQQFREKLEYNIASPILNREKVHRSISQHYINWLVHSGQFF